MLEWWIELPARYNDAIIIVGGTVTMGVYATIANYFGK